MNMILNSAMLAIVFLAGSACLFAGDVQAPHSLTGAQCDIGVNSWCDGSSWEGSECKITKYEPKGNSALITAIYVDKRKETPSGGEYYEKNPDRYRRYYLSGESSYEKASGKNPKPATIVFTDRGGRLYYKGLLKGYLTCDKKQEAEKLNGEIIIMLDEKYEEPELIEWRKEFCGGELSGREANALRCDFIGYWDTRLNKIYQSLMAYYAECPVVAGKLKTAQRSWIACRDATAEAYGLCLKEGKEDRRVGSWYMANITRLLLDCVESRCLLLEDLLDLVKLNNLRYSGE